MTPLPAADIRGLLDRYERPLIRYAQSIVGDLESARDVVQDTFIRYRKHSRIIPMPLPEERQSEERGPDEMLASQDAAEWLLKLLDALTPNQREVIRLKFQSDLSYKEISDVTGLSVTNVGFILHVGLKKLRALLHEAPIDALPVRLRTKP
jgi:RNA polymerase sigma-70 factor (ECF subfamily)